MNLKGIILALTFISFSPSLLAEEDLQSLDDVYSAAQLYAFQQTHVG